MSWLSRVCHSCGAQFIGGPRAYYCPACRAERQRQQKAKYARRKRTGNVRPLGSIDKCERCNKSYTVESGIQRFCPVCQPIHAAEHDRETSIEFYHQHKAHNNPARNERRRIGPVNCEWCGSEFDRGGTKRATCSDECKRLLKNQKWREWHKMRKR